MGTPCLFLDRDGIVNEVPDPARYVVSLDRFRMIPACLDAIRVAAEIGHKVVIVTNQRGISIGHMSQGAVDEIHAFLEDRIREAGLTLDGIYVCPHDDNTHPWRKPNPGMLIQAARDHDLDLPASWMVGDKETDVTTGHRAGCQTIRVGPLEHPSAATRRVATMDQLPGLLREVLAPAGPPPTSASDSGPG